jgi:cytochrome c553
MLLNKHKLLVQVHFRTSSIDSLQSDRYEAHYPARRPNATNRHLDELRHRSSHFQQGEVNMKRFYCRQGTLVLLSLVSLSAAATVAAIIPNLEPFQDPTGAVSSFNTGGAIHENNAFFQPLGTNGRTCATCHQADQAFSISAAGVQEVYERTHGQDPLFAAFDGANCPTDTSPTDISKDRAAHSLLLDRGLIRIGITLPAGPQFQISVVRDPYGCAITTDPATGRPLISVYRRPLPSTNLRYLSAIMFDGRETLMPLNSAQTFNANLSFDLTDQAITAVQTHSQGQTPSAEQLAEIVRFEMGFTTAQVRDNEAGSLNAHGAGGGALTLSSQPYYPGINDALGGDPTGAKFNPSAFSLYTAWEKPSANGHRYDGRDGWNDKEKNQAREDIAAGEVLFNSKPVLITGVRGLNDNATLGSPASITGTCTTCHDSPNVGDHSVALPLDIATSRQPGYETNSAIISALRELSAPDLPVFEISGCPDPANPGQTINYYTSDPGKGLVSGLCADVNRGKGPILRGLAVRAPYFHNGAAANLTELVNFYNQRFQMNLTSKEKEQLIAFLNSL